MKEEVKQLDAMTIVKEIQSLQLEILKLNPRAFAPAAPAPSAGAAMQYDQEESDGDETYAPTADSAEDETDEPIVSARKRPKPKSVASAASSAAAAAPATHTNDIATDANGAAPLSPAGGLSVGVTSLTSPYHTAVGVGSGGGDDSMGIGSLLPLNVSDLPPDELRPIPPLEEDGTCSLRACCPSVRVRD